MTRRATLGGAIVCVAFFLLVALAANVVGNDFDGARSDAATRFLDGGATSGVSDENGDSTSPTEPIQIENFANGEAISYSVALLRGTAPGVERGTVVVENLSSSRPTRITRAPVVAGRFKVLVELVPGENRLTPAVGKSRIDFCLTRRPDDNPRFVRLIYFVDSTGDETFATPEFWTADATEVARYRQNKAIKTVLTDVADASDVRKVAQYRQNKGGETVLTSESAAESERIGGKTSNNFRAKIGTAALLWQTATAERLNDAGYGRRTFSLELDEAGDPIVWVLRGEKTAAQYAALSETERFRAIYREIEASKLASEFARYFVSVAFARKFGETGGAEEVGEADESGENAPNKAVATAKLSENDRINAFLTISTIGAIGEVKKNNEEAAFGEDERNSESAASDEDKQDNESATSGENKQNDEVASFGGNRQDGKSASNSGNVRYGGSKAKSESASIKENGAVGGIVERGRPGSTWARVALGGGSVAALDASTLFAWPDSLVDVADAFADARPISEDFAADSGFRRTRWALTASTLGAGLHELGHAFGLDHSPEPTDLMSRGFDRFNRIFTVVEPPDANSSNAVESVFSDETAATWTTESANRLIRSRWIEK